MSGLLETQPAFERFCSAPPLWNSREPAARSFTIVESHSPCRADLRRPPCWPPWFAQIFFSGGRRGRYRQAGDATAIVDAFSVISHGELSLFGNDSHHGAS